VLVREYQGERHTVTVVPGGYVWREVRGRCKFSTFAPLRPEGQITRRDFADFISRQIPTAGRSVVRLRM